ncbi:MAG: tyrosine-type recombinase/integrase [Rhodospirillales bacterium]
MTKVQIRYLVSKLRAGRLLYYWQPGRTLRAAGFHSRRLADDLETAICEAEALNHRLDDWRNGIEASPFKPETIPWLIRLYRADERYQRLAASTRRGYDQCLGVIENWSARAGHPPVKSLRRKIVRAFYRSMADTPAQANAVMRVLRVLLQLAVDEGFLDENPAKKPGMRSRPPRQGIWSNAQIAAFVAAARKAERPSMALAVLLGAYLGQREGDILRLTWAQYDGTTITLRQSKTGVLLPVPVASQLKAALDEALAQLREHDGENADARAANVVALPKAKPAKPTSAGDGPAGSTLGRGHGSADGSDLVLFESAVRQSPVILISESTSRAYKADHFRHEFRRIAKAAGIGLQFLDLRRSAVVHLAEADCTIPQISAITGHQLDRTTRILETYLPRTAPMAKAAIHKLELYRKRTELEF